MSVDLTDFGVAVGHATDEAGATGLTVIRGVTQAMRGGVAVFGRASGSRELAALAPDHLVNGRVDAVLLTGGSAYGLDAAAGVMRWLEEQGRGFDVGAGVVPIVPAAVVYDLAPLGRFDARPTVPMAYDAAATASARGISEGAVGAGTGTTVGKAAGPMNAMKGGFGLAVRRAGSSAVAAFAVVNAVGDVRDASGRIIAGARGSDGTFVDTQRLLTSGAHGPRRFDEMAARNTTLGVVVSNAPLTAIEATQLARAAGAALFHRITPAGSSLDGDIVFALSPEAGERAEPMVVESLAVLALEDAIERAVRLAHGREGIPGLADEKNGR